MEAERCIVRNGRIYTLDLEGGRSVYGEPLIEIDHAVYREWIPWRSKMAALLKKEGNAPLPEGDLLYLGAAQGTTVSHLSDLLPDDTIYAVEFSRTPFRKLTALSKRRGNIIPILADAFHPETYRMIVPDVEYLYQDVSQKDQVGMLFRNADIFLRKGGTACLMLKARSVDVTSDPARIFGKVRAELERRGMKVKRMIDLSPFQVDHAAFIVTGTR